MRRWKKTLLLPWALFTGGVAGITYIVRDLFTTVANAPLASPRTCEPGPGTLTITDTGNKFSTTGTLLRAATGTGANDPRVATAVTLASVPGRSLYCTFKINASGDLRAGFRADTSGVANLGLSASGTTLSIINSSSYNNGLTFATGTTYELLVVLRGKWAAQNNAGTGGGGVFVFVKGGVYTNWQLVGVGNSNYANLVSMNLGNVSASATGGFDIGSLTVFDLCGALGTQYGLATMYQVYPWVLSNPTTWTITADASIECAYKPAAAEVFEIRTRYVDDSNCFIVRCDQAGSTIRIYEKNAGVETQRATAAQTWTTTAYFRIRVYQNGATIRVNVLDGTGAIVQYTSASFQQTATGLVFTGGATVQDGVAWPITFPSIDITALGTVPILFWPYGDSVTNGTGDSTPPALGSNGYPPRLAELLSTSTRGAWEYPTRVAVGGRTTATAKAAIDAELAAITIGTTNTNDPPQYVLYNLGANDISAMPSQATWQTNALYIWDAIHTKWPNTKIYVMKVWVRGQNANADTYDDTWLPTAVALRSGFVFLNSALDERVFLKGSDDGNTYTTDGIHPNAAGYDLMAAAWQTALGL